MTPAPQEGSPQVEVVDLPDPQQETIVISGISGVYPETHSVEELCEKLYNKDNPISKQGIRFKFNHPEVVQYGGSVPDLQCFDAQFFKVHYRLSQCMDPMGRMILEHAYQAIYDAGVNPVHLSGKKIGVYIGTCFSESEKTCFYEAASRSGFGIAGCSKTMFANRVSYWLNAKGPSMSIDEACCSSTAALEQAFLAMSRGECEAAIVGGAYLCLHPQSAVHYGRLMKLCQDGKTKSFDENADGCAKSEAINVLFLQKAKDALRVYAQVVHAKTQYTGILSDETGPKYGFERELEKSVSFVKTFYEEAKISPQAVEYVEAFGCAVPEADKTELQSIEKVYCDNRPKPLLVGSVLSNIGYNEAASGLSGVTKVLLGYHTGKLAANLHCTNPRQDVVALKEGRMRIVTEHEPFSRQLTAINGLSVTGLNAHVLLHGQYRPKDLARYKSSIPYLVTISGRHEAAVTHILNNLKSQPIDPEQLRLLNNIHQTSISGHLGRGFTILKTDEEEQKTVCLSEKSTYFDNAAKPLWFVYSGMGSQWAGMGAELMRIPIFAAAIERCRRVLEPKGIDIVNIITSQDEKMFDNILHSFVGIAAVQIGLTDVLTAVGLVPDGIIGHSVGELGCAYADGCLTAEEMILSAYSRGLVSLETPFIRGSMAAIGLGYENIVTMCPPEIEVACHNGPESSTISGPADKMKEFVAELTAKGIFAKEVPCSNIAYHSRYIAGAGPGLLKYLSEVITSPKPRTKRWLSSSVPQDKWDTPGAQLCSAHYHTNNLLSPVLFEETSRLIPADAVLVEVAPHGLLQAILKRSLPSTCTNIALTRRKHKDNAFLVLESIGKLFMEGYNPKLHVLYPEIELPVSTGTPFLSNLVQWAHGETWSLAYYKTANRTAASSCDHLISWHDAESNYLKGNSIRGRTLFPFAATFILVWDTLSMILGLPKKQHSVKFSQLNLFAQPILHDMRQLKLNVTLCRGTGDFEVISENTKIATGSINLLEKDKEKRHEEPSKVVSLDLTAEDIYKALQDRDYSYKGEFRSIAGADESFNAALIAWNNNWVTLIDGILQLHMLREPHTAVSVPSRIRTLTIDVERHDDIVKSVKKGNKALLKAEVDEQYDITRCGGVSLSSIMVENLPPVREQQMSLEALKFVPNTKSVKNETWGSEHFVSVNDSVTVSKDVTLQSTKIGDLDSLTWVEAPKTEEAGVEVKVHYAGLNQADVRKVVSGLQDTNNRYGMDFSGVTNGAQRVMGLVPAGAASSVVRARPELLWPVPAHWSLEDAATVPLAYAQAFYCLMIKSDINTASSVLVHGGSGAFGQAVISIALAYDCKVFTTVSDTHKKRFLLKLFPKLKAEHIGYSRNASFKDMVKINTQGLGCRIVINTMGGKHKNASIDCVDSHGIFIDNSQIPELENFSYGMFHLTRERNYTTTDFQSMFKEENINDRIFLKNMITNGITSGVVRPLSRVSFAPREVSRAFRLLAASRHRGKVLLNMTDSSVQVQPRITATSEGSHLILCNEETLGLQLADRLVERGAKKLCVYVERQSMPYVQLKIRSWQRSGVRVVVLSDDVNEEVDVTALVSTATRLGPLEGVYVTVGNKTPGSYEGIVNSLDAVTRKLCAGVKYFAVLNVGGTTIGTNACLKRAQDKLPATLLALPELGDEAASYRSAVDAAERALRSAHPVLRATPLPATQTSLLQEIISIAKISIPSQPDNVLTLEDLGLESDKISSLLYLFRVKYNMYFEPEQISSMTIERINKLSKILAPTKRDHVEGLSNYFSYVDSDELLATTEFVFMPTRTCSAFMRDDEFDTTQSFLCLVPGIEGHYNKFQGLCERLKLTALVLQPGLDKPNESARETAERYAAALLKKTGLQKKFYLLGYENGVSVALEIAAILEDNGLTGIVYCVGYSPEGFTKSLEKELSKYETKEQLQDAVARHMSTLMAKGDTTGLDSALQGASTWSQKVDSCVRTLLGRVSHSAQYARALIETALVRIEKARTHVPSRRALRSQLVQLLPAAGAEEARQYSLQHHSQQPVIVHELDVPLALATSDLRCPAIINSYLDTKILEDFETKNICNTYLLNSDSYMQLNEQ